MDTLEPSVAEAMATFYAVSLCQTLGFHSIFLEGDEQFVFDAMKSKERNGSRYGHLVEDTILVLRSFSKWHNGHVCRDVNKAAHTLAKEATNKS